MAVGTEKPELPKRPFFSIRTGVVVWSSKKRVKNVKYTESIVNDVISKYLLQFGNNSTLFWT